MRCKDCNTENFSFQEYCRKCGKDLTAQKRKDVEKKISLVDGLVRTDKKRAL